MSRITLVLFWLLTGSAAAVEPIRLNTDIFPPYQVREGERLGGTSVHALDCIFRLLERPYEIRVMPWSRAIHEVGQQQADGFFSATRTRQAESFAQLSAPLALEKWYWYSNQNYPPTPQMQRDGLRVGGIRGSNQSAWLEHHGFQIEPQVSSHQQLLQLLKVGRIDAFVADQRTLRMEMTQLPGNLRPPYQHFVKYSTLGVYFGNHFLEQQPEFLESFNASVHSCLRERPHLGQEEQHTILDLYLNRFADWTTQPLLHDSVIQQNAAHASLGLPGILLLDQQWISELQQPQRPLIDGLLAHPASRWLSEQQQASDGLITEIMLTDRFGLNVAISEVTSDYWQGDEEKFAGSFFAESDQPVVGPLEYDESTRLFQVHISTRLRDPRTGEAIGVLIVGVDIERAMQLAYSPP